MAHCKYIILGGGVTAGYAAQEFVKQGVKPGELCIISAENWLPYDRPPLSKGVLQGKKPIEKALINDAEFYRQNSIDTRLVTRIAETDLRNKTLRAENGEDFTFDNLLIATGSRVRQLKSPGADLGGVLYLRTTEDNQKIVAAAKKGQNAVIIGGSFIGSEVAASLTQRDVKVTMVFPDEHLMQGKPHTPEMSAFFESYFRERGIGIMAGEKVASLKGDGMVSTVVLESGRELPADFVVAGVGVQLNTDLFEGSPLHIDDGILVDEYLETNVPGVYAAGDIARYPDKIFDKPRRVEHWDNAQQQGMYWARLMFAGKDREPFVHVPYFFSDVFDLSWEYWGDSKEGDTVVYRGDVTSPSFSAWWLKGDRVMAAFVMARPDAERDAAQALIESGQSISAAALGDEKQPLPTPETSTHTQG
ncbi:MAG: FAD-dependent oxidoreductase [Burkholderiales bacterium]|nr:FAD-dependent oxidoreductase [Anaerolineae bacterium]